jgi:hypothetical protein
MLDLISELFNKNIYKTQIFYSLLIDDYMSEMRLLENPAEEYIAEFTNTPLALISPSSLNWNSRVALEIKNLMNYIDYLKTINNGVWFFLKPSIDKRYNFQRWDGILKIPARPDIQFDLRIILTSEYPYVFPRAFAEESIKNYCAGNIFPKNIWRDDSHDTNSKNYIMICHDHMKELHAWNPGLSITHFLIREVWYWWMSKMNRIIQEWDKKKLGF